MSASQAARRRPSPTTTASDLRAPPCPARHSGAAALSQRGACRASYYSKCRIKGQRLVGSRVASWLEGGDSLGMRRTRRAAQRHTTPRSITAALRGPRKRLARRCLSPARRCAQASLRDGQQGADGQRGADAMTQRSGLGCLHSPQANRLCRRRLFLFSSLRVRRVAMRSAVCHAGGQRAAAREGEERQGGLGQTRRRCASVPHRSPCRRDKHAILPSKATRGAPRARVAVNSLPVRLSR